MTQAPNISTREMGRIVLCLTITCLLAGAILGGVYLFTEPRARTIRVARDAAAVRTLLDLVADDRVQEVRRYLSQDQQSVAYLLATELRQYSVAGAHEKTTPRPAELAKGETQALDQWVTTTHPGMHYAGRFYVALHADDALAGYVVESEQYGFKSTIRFLVALTPAFQIRGVEVMAQEEDPGLGAEIIRPEFIHQFAGRPREALPQLEVTKEPMPAQWRRVVRARQGVPFDDWTATHADALAHQADHPIYAVTGATISSRALTEGVKRAVAHLGHRLRVVGLEQTP